MTPTDSSHQPSENQVPGQFLGYGLQYTRMLSLLLESDAKAVVSLEVFEDVGVQDGSSTIASQVKSSTTNNPVSNRAEPLWKSLLNWLEAIKAGQVSVTDTQFELYVYGDFQGQICSWFSDARSDAEARDAISKAETLLRVKGKDLPSQIKAVLNSDRNVFASLITHFRYRHGSGASIADLKEQLMKALIPTEFVDNVLTHALGGVKQKVDSLVERGYPAAISVADFRTELVAYARSVIFTACFADLAGPPIPGEIEEHRAQRYVRQLDLISASDERKLRAISAYLRSSANRSEWALRGLVHQNSLDDFEYKLVDYWQNSRTQCEIALKDRDATDRGQYLLSECMKCSASLEGRSVPGDFVEGCFHDLSDELTVGWHPDFKTLTMGWK